MDTKNYAATGGVARTGAEGEERAQGDSRRRSRGDIVERFLWQAAADTCAIAGGIVSGYV